MPGVSIILFSFSLKFISNHINVIIYLIIEVRIAALDVIWKGDKFDNCSQAPGIIIIIIVIITANLNLSFILLPEWYLLME